MCTLALLYRVARGTPILVAANRDERFDRPTQYPKIQSGTPRVVCGIDRQAGGTWLGVNQYGLFCAVASRPKRGIPLEPRSRGLLCRELLELRTAKDAAAHAAKELSTGAYAGANYVCADGRYAAVVHGGDRIEVVELQPGLHVVTNGNVDDIRDERHEFVRRMLTLHTLDSAVTFLAVASRVFSRRPNGDGRRGVVFSDGEFGTVSSTLLALPRKIQQAVYQYASGAPCDCAYDDLSALLRQVLSTERSRKNQEGNGEAAKSREKAKAVAGKAKELAKKGKGH
ncbi:MAG: NRDE family protein [Thermoguttaceae bacterium]